MVTFSRAGSNLFVAQDTGTWVGLYVASPGDKTSYGLADALATPDASFVFASGASSSLSSNAQAVAGLVKSVVDPTAYNRVICWLTDPVGLSSQSVPFMPLTDSGTLGSALSAPLVPNQLGVVVPAQTAVGTDETGAFLVLSSTSQPTMQLGGSAVPDPQSTTMAGEVFLACSGAGAGCLTLAAGNALYIRRSTLFSSGMLNCGFQILCPDSKVQQGFDSQFYPLADPNWNGSDMIGFAPTVDPSDPAGLRTPGRTRLAFTGTNQDGSTTVLSSYYRTPSGLPVMLTPVGAPASGETVASLAIAYAATANGAPVAFTLMPDGDFVLGVPDGATSAMLMCGLLPTETATFAEGDRLRFASYRAACAANYPPQPASTLQPPVDPDAPLLTTAFVTSWASLIPAAAANSYSSQSVGFPLFGLDAVVHPASPAMLGSVPTGLPMTSSESFPLLPYGGVAAGTPPLAFTPAMLADIEAKVLAPARGKAITPSGRAAAERSVPGQGGAATTATTPTGFVVTLEAVDGATLWTAIDLALGTDADGNPTSRMRFVNPDPVLQQAFRAPQLFLVATNPEHFGTPTLPPPQAPAPSGSAPQFQNVISVLGWEVAAEVGYRNSYADYNNVLIIKSFVGSLADLAASPAQWTLPEAFSIPPGGSAAEITAVSQWLQNYIAAAAADQSGNFAAFNQIVTDPHWNGILVLKPSLTKLPGSIAGLLGSMPRSAQYAHHFGVSFNRVHITPAIELDTPSSMFMLVDYVAPGFTPPTQGTPQPLPVAVSAEAPYGFILLTLIAEFVNSAVQNFVSYAQLTLGEFFSDPVLRMAGQTGNPYDTILLTGVYQNNNGHSLFLLDSTADNLFMMDSNVINKVEVTKALFTTVDDSTNRFDLWGYVDFALLPVAHDDGEVPFDAFGYGSLEDAPETPRAGLYFSGLGIVMSTAASGATSFTFDTSRLTFDTSQSSAPRPDGLPAGFALQLQSFVVSASGQAPADLDYLELSTWANLGGKPAGAQLSGVGSDLWYGFAFNINLGTLGVLANKAGFKSSLLVAWSPGNGRTSQTRAVTVALQIPGVTAQAPTFSLEGVLRLAIGSLNLTFTPKADGTPAYWLLNIDNIALTFLGFLSLPPTGAIDFALFGDREAKSGSALGWYAIYNKLKADKAGSPARIEGPRS